MIYGDCHVRRQIQLAPPLCVALPLSTFVCFSISFFCIMSTVVVISFVHMFTDCTGEMVSSTTRFLRGKRKHFPESTVFPWFFLSLLLPPLLPPLLPFYFSTFLYPYPGSFSSLPCLFLSPFPLSLSLSFSFPPSPVFLFSLSYVSSFLSPSCLFYSIFSLFLSLFLLFFPFSFLYCLLSFLLFLFSFILKYSV